MVTMTTTRGEPFTVAEVDAMSDDGRFFEYVDGSLVVSGRPFTRQERDDWPDDGRRHELIDGVLVVTPSPTPRHQGVELSIYRMLFAPCPDNLAVYVAPLDVTLAPASVVEPDVLVVRKADVTERDIAGIPLLAVEVLSPSTRRIDLGRKRDRYRRAGVPSYWVVDPDVPSLVAWELRDGEYVEVANARGAERASLTAPYAVEVVPDELMR
jgi:Uma2 family endonuclease